MSKSNMNKSQQLGMAHGTAANKLRKSIIWDYVLKNGDNTCFQCGEVIEDIGELSIEHKKPWLDSEDPSGLYFDLDNIAYSHLSCNCRAGTRKRAICGTRSKYLSGCRCQDCKDANASSGRERYKPERRRERYLRLEKE